MCRSLRRGRPGKHDAREKPHGGRTRAWVAQHAGGHPVGRRPVGRGLVGGRVQADASRGGRAGHRHRDGRASAVADEGPGDRGARFRADRRRKLPRTLQLGPGRAARTHGGHRRRRLDGAAAGRARRRQAGFRPSRHRRQAQPRAGGRDRPGALRAGQGVDGPRACGGGRAAGRGTPPPGPGRPPRHPARPGARRRRVPGDPGDVRLPGPACLRAPPGRTRQRGLAAQRARPCAAGHGVPRRRHAPASDEPDVDHDERAGACLGDRPRHLGFAARPA